MSRSKHPTWQRRYDGVLLWVIEHPCATQTECASATGYTTWQISRITSSPEFRRRYGEIIETELERAGRRYVDSIFEHSWFNRVYIRAQMLSKLR